MNQNTAAGDDRGIQARRKMSSRGHHKFRDANASTNFELPQSGPGSVLSDNIETFSFEAVCWINEANTLAGALMAKSSRVLIQSNDSYTARVHSFSTKAVTNGVQHHVDGPDIEKTDMETSQKTSPVGPDSSLKWLDEEIQLVWQPEMMNHVDPLSEVIPRNNKRGNDARVNEAWSSSWSPLPPLDGKYGNEDGNNNWISGPNIG